MITRGTATAAPKILMPRASGAKIKNVIQAAVASVRPKAASGAAHATRSSTVSAWIGSMFIVARKATQA
jgi:hypothetical protein